MMKQIKKYRVNTSHAIHSLFIAVEIKENKDEEKQARR